MPRCYFCGKGTSLGRQVSHAGNRSLRVFRANIKRTRVNVGGEVKRLHVCTTCIKVGRHLWL